MASGADHAARTGHAAHAEVPPPAVVDALIATSRRHSLGVAGLGLLVLGLGLAAWALPSVAGWLLWSQLALAGGAFGAAAAAMRWRHRTAPRGGRVVGYTRELRATEALRAGILDEQQARVVWPGVHGELTTAAMQGWVAVGGLVVGLNLLRTSGAGVGLAFAGLWTALWGVNLWLAYRARRRLRLVAAATGP